MVLLGCGVAHAATFTGTVFEDANYGGGAGRTRVASGGAVLTGVTVELYSVTGGIFLATTTTNASGVYSFDTGVSAISVIVRVVNGSVRSARTGGAACTTCVPVQTFRTDASSGTAVNVTNRVGGETPGSSDAVVNPGGLVFDLRPAHRGRPRAAVRYHRHARRARDRRSAASISDSTSTPW